MISAMHRAPSGLLAYCLMPNHWDMIVWNGWSLSNTIPNLSSLLVKLQLRKRIKNTTKLIESGYRFFKDQEQAEAHGLELCKEWMDKLMECRAVMKE
jgi:hypothetical protein